jgi:phosphoribosyl 1,2-cyclic phosphodiesterase
MVNLRHICMKIIVLGSGSKGNCTYYESTTTTFFIDCGFSTRDIRARLAQREIELQKLDAIVITHEHSDHVAGLPSIYKYYQPKLYISAKTYQGLAPHIKQSIPTSCLVIYETLINWDDVTVTPFLVSHDANEPFGFIVEHQSKKVVHCADTGYVPRALFDRLRGADGYLFESNYDPELLLDTDRPFMLKQRIIGNSGHLSNEQSALVLRELLSDNTQFVVFIHLSQEANTEHHAMETHRLFLNHHPVERIYSRQDEPTKVIEL